MKKNYFSINLKRLILCTVIFFLCHLFIITQAESVQNQSFQQSQPHRIVVFPLYAEEILLDMIGPERIVYVGHEYWEEGSSYSPTMPLTQDIPGAPWQNSDENFIAKLAPDLLIFSAELEDAYQNGDLFPILHQKNISVLFVSPPTNIQDIELLIHTLGEAVDASKEANRMLQEMDAELLKIEAIVNATSENNTPKVIYYAPWQAEYNLLSEYCRLNTMFEEKTDYIPLNNQQIAEWNPDIILFNPVWLDTDGSILGIDPQYAEDVRLNLLNNSDLANTTAIKEGRVYPINLHSSHYVVHSLWELISYFCPCN